MIKFVLTLLLTPLLLYFRSLWLLVHLLPNGKEQMLLQSIRWMINKFFQVIYQYIFCLCAINFLKSLFSTHFSSFLWTKICYLNINWVFTRMIHVLSTSYLQSSFDCNPTLETHSVFLDIYKALGFARWTFT